MKKAFLWILIMSCYITACKSKKTVVHAQNSDIELLVRQSTQNPLCRDYTSYIPDTIIPEAHITYTIKMIFHIIEGPFEQTNFDLPSGKIFFTNMINNCNQRLDLNERMKLPIDNTTPVLHPKIKFDIGTKKLEGVNSFNHHLEDEPSQAYFLNKGMGQNNYNTTIIKKYAVRDDSLLNVFIMSFPPKLMKDNPSEYHGSGIALGSSIKIGGLHQKGGPDWGYATMFTHEVGHILGLGHAWVHDGCDDTPIHPNCFGDNLGPCEGGGNASNNLMDYNNSQMAVTPCQIGKVRQSLAQEGNFQRQLLDFDFCENSDKSPIVIQSKIKWSGERDLDRSNIIKKGGRLHICCRLSLPRDGFIRVEKGGELILDGVKIHNACGYDIKGVEVVKGGKVVDIREKG
ncbi:MAG TPA: M43 family zinc metalloprotease [Saprospiraceae bacterium]|nr:M43 family zinc metalloprotease [Saprospiraceae bacterium]